MNKKFLIHPFLYAILPVLVLYKQNISEAWPSLMFTPVIYSVALAILSWFIFLFFLRNKHKASVMTSIWLVLFFSYGHTYLFLANKGVFNYIPVGPHLFLLGSYFGILLLSYLLVFKMKDSVTKLTAFFNVASITLLLINLVYLVPYEMKRYSSLQTLDKYTQEHSLVDAEFLNKDEDTYPDIYYFVFDRFPNQTISNDYFGYDTTSFLEGLEDKGFYVATQSAANHPSSFQSISSSLNMNYLTFLPELIGDDYTDRSIIYKELLEDNDVTKFLIGKGYNYYHLGSSWEASRQSYLATQNYNKFIGFNVFESFLYENTLLNVLIGKLNGESTFTSVELLELHQENVPYKVEKIKKLSKESDRKFVFSHFLLPHPPYLFNENCEKRTFEEVRNTPINEAYVKQIECATKTINDLAETIIENSQRPVVIVIQSDEGPFISLDHADEYEYYDINAKDAIQVHSRILNTYYINDKEDLSKTAIYEDLGLNQHSSPVNSFRTIFNYYFGTNFELFDNKTYIFEDPYKPYRFIDVTDQVWD